MGRDGATRRSDTSSTSTTAAVGMCFRDKPLTVGAELTDGGTVYRVERVEPPPNPNAFGHAWVTRLGGS
jgi:hypothetical protein